ncbi:hypothetical protein [Bacillus sp. B1-b2]|uniref:hypothetical protein n=1 Tax=Bacillus sp. B1-b2 TaxID=2653201 RepID=UPI001261E92D|nr:hypothetical protein [Bacillus sp. B1-b2]KAB7665607.1 hypothetical protein F9279_19855 [Bacillus sp. B1-b2]
MKTKTIGAIMYGLGIMIVVGFTIYKLVSGSDIGFNEIITIGVLLMGFLSVITWGSKGEKDGIQQDEELGQKITEKSSKIGYFVLTFFIIIAVGLDSYFNETSNIFLLLLLGLSMVILPFVEFLYVRRFR